MTTEPSGSERSGLSVLLPTYNAKECLVATVVRLLAPPFTDVKILVIDQGAADSTSEFLSALAEREQRLRLLKYATNQDFVVSGRFDMARLG